MIYIILNFIGHMLFTLRIASMSTASIHFQKVRCMHHSLKNLVYISWKCLLLGTFIYTLIRDAFIVTWNSVIHFMPKRNISKACLHAGHLLSRLHVMSPGRHLQLVTMSLTRAGFSWGLSYWFWVWFSGRYYYLCTK